MFTKVMFHSLLGGSVVEIADRIVYQKMQGTFKFVREIEITKKINIFKI
jgi:hypothetical protein